MDDSTRSKILVSAGELFAADGYAKVSIREICARAGANVAAVNYYFRDKQNLYVETVREARLSRARDVPLPDWESETPPEQKLHDVISTLLQRVNGWQQPPWQVQLMMREVLFPTEACSDLVNEYFRPFMEKLMGVVDEFFPGKPLANSKRQQVGFSIIGQVMLYRFTSNSLQMMVGDDELKADYQQSTLADHITKFSLAGISGIAVRSEGAGAAEQNVGDKEIQRP